ncbi:hypothetical protein [Zhenpiania hominis]|uniref:hypothetical protein n=1 Tax=Zhenpiania hominis TaxID=2763644 RepID=UPI0039F515F3
MKTREKEAKKEAIINKILACKEKLGLDTLPTARQLAGFGIYSQQLICAGGLSEVSRITGIPMKGRAYTRRKKLSEEEIIQKILDSKEALGIDHMPTVLQLYEIGLTQNDLKRIGGLTRVSREYGIPFKRTGREPKKALGAGQRIRPSRAFEKEREARKQGLHYADLQKAETLRLYGKVEISRRNRMR